MNAILRALLASGLLLGPASERAAADRRAAFDPTPSDSLAAHPLTGVRAGDRVRVTATRLGERSLTGWVVSIDEGRLLLETKKGQPAVELQSSSIREVETSLGWCRQTRRGAYTGAILGGSLVAATLTVGALIVGVDPDNRGSFFAHASRWTIEAAAVSGLLGALAGSFVESEEWAPVTPGRAGFRLAPRGRGGVAASVSITF